MVRPRSIRDVTFAARGFAIDAGEDTLSPEFRAKPSQSRKQQNRVAPKKAGKEKDKLSNRPSDPGY